MKAASGHGIVYHVITMKCGDTGPCRNGVLWQLHMKLAGLVQGQPQLRVMPCRPVLLAVKPTWQLRKAQPVHRQAGGRDRKPVIGSRT